MLSPASPWCWMVPSPTASRTAPSSVSSKRPANAPSEKRVANLFTTVGGTRSNACSSTGGGGVCAEQSSAGIAKRRSSKKSVFRPSTPNCLTLEIESFWNSSFPLARMASTSRSLTRPAALSASPLYISRLSRSRPGAASAGVSFWVSNTSVDLLRGRKPQYVIADVWANIPPKSNRSDPICFSPYLYRARNRVERFFNRIKQCRRVATRYDRLAANYLAFVQLASISLWLRFYESASWFIQPSFRAREAVSSSYPT